MDQNVIGFILGTALVVVLIILAASKPADERHNRRPGEYDCPRMRRGYDCKGKKCKHD